MLFEGRRKEALTNVHSFNEGHRYDMVLPSCIYTCMSSVLIISHTTSCQQVTYIMCNWITIHPLWVASLRNGKDRDLQWSGLEV